jgi:Tfp pilus assembly protein PilX
MNDRWELLKKTCSAKAGRYGERRRVFEPRAGERGIALVFTLLLLSMMSLMALAMVLSSSSDMLINGYYSNARGSFYAADSGLSIARQQLVNQVLLQFPSIWSAPPLPDARGPATIALKYITDNYTSSTPLNKSGQAVKSWPGQFEITNVTFAPVGTPTVTSYCTPPACPAVPTTYPKYYLCSATNEYINEATGCSYTYQYSLTALGAARGSEQTSISETGTVTVTASGPPETTTVSFANFGGWVGSYPVCLGPLVPGTMTGPMFTNDAWEFMTGGAYIFTDPVGQHNPDADFWFGWNCIKSPTSSYKYRSQLIAPTFEGNPPFSLGQPLQASPTDSFSQEWAVIDGKGCGEGSNVCGSPSTPWPPITPAILNANLENAAGTPYPSTGASSGVYLNYTTDSGVNTILGGGFYVEGDANLALSTSGTSAQVIGITQGSGSNATTTTITIDPLATPPTSWNCPAATTGTTVITTQVGASTPVTVNFCSVPMNLIPTPAQPGTMVYVNGNILSMSGPGQGVPAIQDGAQITITAHGNIDLTGDVIYKTEPVTVADNQSVPGTNPPCCQGLPVATLIPGNDKNQVLGIFTANGNINLMSPYPNHYLQVDGSQAPLQKGSNWCFTCTGYINTFNNVGGQVQSGICGCDMDTENTYFDRRLTSKPGFAPPWFPATVVTTTGQLANPPNPTVKRAQWVLNNMN